MTYLQANTFIIARKLPKLTHFYKAAWGKPSWFTSCRFTFDVTFIIGPTRIPVLKVTNFRCSFGKIPKIPVLELVANKTGDTFVDHRLFYSWFSLHFV